MTYRTEAYEATQLTAEVMADPAASMAERYAATVAEEAAINAWRNQPEMEGAHADLDAGLADWEA